MRERLVLAVLAHLLWVRVPGLASKFSSVRAPAPAGPLVERAAVPHTDKRRGLAEVRVLDDAGIRLASPAAAEEPPRPPVSCSLIIEYVRVAVAKFRCWFHTPIIRMFFKSKLCKKGPCKIVMGTGTTQKK